MENLEVYTDVIFAAEIQKIKRLNNGCENIEVYQALDISQKKLLPLIGSFFMFGQLIHDRTAHPKII